MRKREFRVSEREEWGNENKRDGEREKKKRSRER